jgi:hypothetical protein
MVQSSEFVIGRGANRPSPSELQCGMCIVISHFYYIVPHLLKARTVEPEKQLLLDNARTQQ